MPQSFPRTWKSAEIWHLRSGCHVDSADVAVTSRIYTFDRPVTVSRSTLRDAGQQRNLCRCAAMGKLCGIRLNACPTTVRNSLSGGAGAFA
jgi:hypothetical protein